jgi:GntR family transcriptional regulator of vanillate catabolism
MIATFQIRAELEALACSNVVKTEMDHDTIITLQNCLRTGDEILIGNYFREEDKERYREMNRTFHDTIICSSGNNMLMTFVRQTNNIPLASSRMVVWSEHYAVNRSHDDHHRIFYALRDKDSMRAKALMHEHIRYAGEYLQNQLKNKSDVLLSNDPHNTDERR